LIQDIRESPRLESSPAATTAPSEPDVYDKLRKLGELRDAGVLTPEEFEVKKASLLSQM
jgi:hypothetical protein